MFFQLDYYVIVSQGLKVEVVALVNDTVGTLMACSSIYRDCKAGIILGTGNEKKVFARCSEFCG